MNINLLRYFFRQDRKDKVCGGFDISDHSIEYVVIGKDKGDICIKFKDRLLLPEEIVENGNIKDIPGLVKMLRGISSGQREVPSAIVMGLSERVVYMHCFSVPKTEVKNLKNTVEEEARKIFPVNYQDLILDYVSHELEGSYEIILAGAEKMVLQKYQELIRQLGYRSAIFEPEALALVRSVVQGDRAATSALIVDFGFRYTGLYITDEGNIRLVSGLGRGGEEITAAIADKFKISRKDAETRKIKLGFKDSELLLILQFIPQLIIQEIIKMANFYKKTYGKNIERILLVGGGSLIPGMPEYFSRNVEKPVLFLSQDESILYSAAIGLALRCFDVAGGINLFRKED